MEELIEYTRKLFHKGMPLAKRVEGRLSVDLDMFSRGGLAVLDAIEAMGYDTLHQRPEVSKVKQVSLLGRALITHVFGGPESNRNGSFAREGASYVAADSSAADIAASYGHCHHIARTAHSNFYPAFFLLPKAKRDGIVALYAFMRLIDDVSDEGEDVAAKQRGLARWRAALDEAITGQAQAFDGNAALHAATRSSARPARSTARAGGYHAAFSNARALSARSDQRRGDGSDDPGVSDLRAPEGILLPRCGNRGAYLHAHFWLSRSARRWTLPKNWASPFN